MHYVLGHVIPIQLIQSVALRVARLFRVKLDRPIRMSDTDIPLQNINNVI